MSFNGEIVVTQSMVRIRYAQLNLPAQTPVVEAKISRGICDSAEDAGERPSARFFIVPGVMLGPLHWLIASYLSEFLTNRASTQPNPSGASRLSDSPAPSKTAIPKTPIVFIGGSGCSGLVMVLIYPWW
jgi:hypothetical protein